MEKKTLEVGDKIRIKTVYSSDLVQIVRLTKTQAVGVGTRGATYRFKKELFGRTPKPIPAIMWDTTERTLITNE